jgi:hypothetical protein
VIFICFTIAWVSIAFNPILSLLDARNRKFTHIVVDKYVVGLLVRRNHSIISSSIGVGNPSVKAFSGFIPSFSIMRFYFAVWGYIINRDSDFYFQQNDFVLLILMVFLSNVGIGTNMH